MINWKIRYGKILARFPELRNAGCTVLEVGAGGSGVRNYLPRAVVSIDIDHAHSLRARPLAITADAARLPIADSSFDFVLCLDTLEHVPPARRATVIGELARVCRETLVIGLPMGAFAAWGDEQFLRLYQERKVPTPNWLAEHLTIGIPSIGSILRTILGLGLDFRIHGNETGIQHYAGLVADEIGFLRGANDALSLKQVDAPPIGCGDGDVYYSYFVEVSKSASATAQRPDMRPAKPLPGAAHGDISLFCVGHDTARFPPLAGITRFFVGEQLPDGQLDGTAIVCDDQYHSIRELNPVFSELTAIYSVWKNVRHADYVGFCHYRRLFNFHGVTNNQRTLEIHSRSEFERWRPAMETVDRCRPVLAAGGVIVAAEDSPMPTVAEQYMRSHFPDHYLTAVNSLLEHYPHLAPYAVRQFDNTTCYMNNMFICSAVFFDQLCAWWFEALIRIQPLLSVPHDPYQQRTLAFLSERLFDIYLRWRFATGTPKQELPIFFLADTTFSVQPGALKTT